MLGRDLLPSPNVPKWPLEVEASFNMKFEAVLGVTSFLIRGKVQQLYRNDGQVCGDLNYFFLGVSSTADAVTVPTEPVSK